MRRSFFLLVMLANVLNGNGQAFFSLRGKLIDAKTKEPIPFASVFFAATALGANTAEDGTFRIDKIPSGKFELIATSVGYKKFSTPILFSDSSLHLNIQLNPDVTTLKEVVVRPNRSEFKKYYPTFVKYFLGITPNARLCTIKNPDAIDLHYDKDENALYGFADEPIQIENKALGYTIYFMLDEFEINYKKDVFKSFGVPRFEELVSKNNARSNRFGRRRNEAYYGSMNHFMRSLLQHRLRENNFLIHRVLNDGREYATTEDSLFLAYSKNEISINGKLKVIFVGQPEDLNYSNVYKGFQTSMISSGPAAITIYNNGHFDDFKSVRLDGYLGYRECLSNLVPLGYQPSNQKK